MSDQKRKRVSNPPVYSAIAFNLDLCRLEGSQGPTPKPEVPPDDALERLRPFFGRPPYLGNWEAEAGSLPWHSAAVWNRDASGALFGLSVMAGWPEMALQMAERLRDVLNTLATTQEPRWPSERDLANALIDSELMARLNEYAVAANPDTMTLESFDTLAKSWAHAILAALREGGERS